MPEAQSRMLMLCCDCAALMDDAYDLQPTGGQLSVKARCQHCGRTTYGVVRYVVRPHKEGETK